MANETWSEIYPAHLDGYQLFGKLNDGDPVQVEVNGVAYRMQFEGDRYGGDNCLVVVSTDGASRLYGRGWDSMLVFQALEEMQRGWHQPQMYRYKSMENVGEVEAI
jgi:hypothetical protein